jgi:hypothetical protein
VSFYNDDSLKKASFVEAEASPTGREMSLFASLDKEKRTPLMLRPAVDFEMGEIRRQGGEKSQLQLIAEQSILAVVE